MYTYIRNFKFEEREITQEEIDALCSDKVKALLVMIREGCVCQINERLLLKYEQDPLLTKESGEIWSLHCEKSWKTLYDRNCESISMAKERAARLEVKMEPLYQSARNLKEYVRLVGRLCRILYEMNQLQELRISTANLLQQLNILLHSLNNYMISAKECL